MAKKQTTTNKKVEEKKPKAKYDVFKDPSESLIGKIVIGIIIFGTIATVFIAAIISVIDYFA